jgi:hypothetical protein
MEGHDNPFGAINCDYCSFFLQLLLLIQLSQLFHYSRYVYLKDKMSNGQDLNEGMQFTKGC